jgi:hypothetical protein
LLAFGASDWLDNGNSEPKRLKSNSQAAADHAAAGDHDVEICVVGRWHCLLSAERL